ncbi:MAG: hypothetical protein C5B50_03505 [Verrucomicrobia bacterium]|nr:MAG: hypothetical protein C5B50_03505 [Verrucomicrobiota bacterium]
MTLRASFLTPRRKDAKMQRNKRDTNFTNLHEFMLIRVIRVSPSSLCVFVPLRLCVKSVSL